MQNSQIGVVDREYAGTLLARRLAEADHINAVVVGIPHGGACVAARIADVLHLPMEVMMCREIEDPTDRSKTVGSVSANDVIMHDRSRTIPQDYIYFQAIRLRNEIKYENDFYYGDEPPLDFRNKTVILVDDILLSADTLLACIREIRKQGALHIIVAVPFVQTEAATIIQPEADAFIFLKMQLNIRSPHEFYQDFPEVKEWQVRTLLQGRKQHLTPDHALITTS
jgi:putative phosphoribosyl transferase